MARHDLRDIRQRSDDDEEVRIDTSIGPAFLAVFGGAIDRIAETLEPPAKNKELALKLGISPSLLSNYLQGSRIPTPGFIVRALENGKTSPTTLPHELDKALIYAGDAPLFCRHIIDPAKASYVLRQGPNGLILEADDAPAAGYFGFHLACRKADTIVVRLDGFENGSVNLLDGSYLLLERVNDREEVSAGDLVLITTESEAELHTLRSNQSDIRNRTILGRVAATYQLPKKSLPTISNLDRIVIGVGPFQDALLPTVGVDLGFFQEEGIVAVSQQIPWYDWDEFFTRSGSEKPAHRILFATLFSFVEYLQESRNNDLVFFYGANLFDRGFSVLAHPDLRLKTVRDLCRDAGKQRDELTPDELREFVAAVLAQLGDDPINTIVKSDWGAQVYSIAKWVDYNLEERGVRGVQPIYAAQQRGRATIALQELPRKVAVKMNPPSIAEVSRFFVGSLPQQVRLKQDHSFWELLEPEDICPPYQVNGFVTYKDVWERHQPLLLRFLHVWFRTVRYINPEMRPEDRGSPAILPPLPARGSEIVARNLRRLLGDKDGSKLVTAGSRNEVVECWMREKFPSNPRDVEDLLGPNGTNPWLSDLARAEEYLRLLTPAAKQISRDAFKIEEMQRAYVRAYTGP